MQQLRNWRIHIGIDELTTLRDALDSDLKSILRSGVFTTPTYHFGIKEEMNNLRFRADVGQASAYREAKMAEAYRIRNLEMRKEMDAAEEKAEKQAKKDKKSIESLIAKLKKSTEKVEALTAALKPFNAALEATNEAYGVDVSKSYETANMICQPYIRMKHFMAVRDALASTEEQSA